jgi:hypothetical protein
MINCREDAPSGLILQIARWILTDSLEVVQNTGTATARAVLPAVTELLS